MTQSNESRGDGVVRVDDDKLPIVFYNLKRFLGSGAGVPGDCVAAFKVADCLSYATACFPSKDGVIVLLQDCPPEDAGLIAVGEKLALLRKNMVDLRKFLSDHPEIRVEFLGMNERGQHELDFGSLGG